MLFFIWSGRKQTFFHCNDFGTVRVILLGWLCNTKDLEIRFSAMIHIKVLLSLLHCPDVRAGVSSLQPHSLGVSGRWVFFVYGSVQCIITACRANFRLLNSGIN